MKLPQALGRVGPTTTLKKKKKSFHLSTSKKKKTGKPRLSQPRWVKKKSLPLSLLLSPPSACP